MSIQSFVANNCTSASSSGLPINSCLKCDNFNGVLLLIVLEVLEVLQVMWVILLFVLGIVLVVLVVPHVVIHHLVVLAVQLVVGVVKEVIEVLLQPF